MNNKTRPSYDSHAQASDIQDLATQIEALEIGPGSVGRALPAAMGNTIARPAQRRPNASLPTVVIPQRAPAVQRSAPTTSKVLAREEPPLRNADEPLGRPQPREHQLKQEAPPTPEVRRKRAPIPLPPAPKIESRTLSSTRDYFRVRIIPKEDTCTIWDGDGTVDDKGLFAWPGTLVVSSSGLSAYTYGPEAVKGFSIQFRALAQPSVHTSRSSVGTQAGDGGSWWTEYTGHRPRVGNGRLPILDVSHGIVVESPSQVEQSELGTWFIRFWAPVPVALFARAEHKSFVCQAKVKIRYGESAAEEVWVSAEDVVVGIERLRLKPVPAVPRALSQ